MVATSAAGRSKKNGNGSVKTQELGKRKIPKITIPKEEKRLLEMQPLNLKVMPVTIDDVTDVIVHAMGPKTQKQLLDIFMRDPSKPKPKRTPKDPFAEFLGSLHVMPGAKIPKKKLKAGESWPFKKDTFGVPCAGFKKGMVYAAQRYGMKAKDVEAAVWVLGELTPLVYKKLIMRQDPVKVGPWNSRVVDIRFRGSFTHWSTTIMVEYDADLITPTTIVNLINRAGRVAGLCEWRPNSKDNPGTFGCYEVRLGKVKK